MFPVVQHLPHGNGTTSHNAVITRIIGIRWHVVLVSYYRVIIIINITPLLTPF